MYPRLELARAEDVPSGQHLVEQTAERVDVRAHVHILRAALLRRHVGRGAQNRPDARQPLARIDLAGVKIHQRFLNVERAHQPEIRHFGDAVVRHEDVGGLEVAVNQPRHALGGVLHPQRNVQPELNRERQRHTLVLDPTAQVGFQAFRSADVFEDDVRAPLNVLHQPRLNDVAVLLQPNPRHRLLHEAGDGALVVEEAALEALERDRLALFVVVAQIDDAHPAPAHVRDFVAPLDAVADVELVVGAARPRPFRLNRRVRLGFVERFHLRRQRRRKLLDARLAQHLLIRNGRALDCREIGGGGLALEDVAVAIGDREVVCAAVRAARPAIRLQQFVDDQFVRGVVILRQRPQHDRVVAPPRIGARRRDQPFEICVDGTPRPLAVERRPRFFLRAAVGDQRLADVEHQQASVVRQRQARAQVAQREQIVHVAAAQRQPSQLAHLAVGIGRKRIALVELVMTAQRLPNLTWRLLDRLPSGLWNFRVHGLLTTLSQSPVRRSSR